MTQAFNLSQLANNLNTSGQLDATDGLTGAVPVANGGTGLSTLTANNVILGNGTSAPLFVAPSTNGNVLMSNGTTWVSSTLSNVIVHQSISTTTVSTSSDTFTGITSVTITPSSINSKFVINATASIVCTGSGQNGCKYQLARGGTQLYIAQVYHGLNNTIQFPISAVYYDEPATTSPITYEFNFSRYLPSGSISTDGFTYSIVVTETQ
jgi:hypothetical protein